MEDKKGKYKNKKKINEDKLYLPKNVQMDKMNAFKLQEKKYRLYQGHKTDFSELINVNDPNTDLNKYNMEKLSIKGYDVYKLKFPPGTYLIKRCLSVEQQLDIGLKCLNEYVKFPYRTNLFIYEDNSSWKDSYGQPISKQDQQKIQSQQLTETNQKVNPQKIEELEEEEKQSTETTIKMKNENDVIQSTNVKPEQQKNQDNQKLEEELKVNTKSETSQGQKQLNQQQSDTLNQKYEEELEQQSAHSQTNSSIQSSSTLGGLSRTYNVDKYLVQDYRKYCFNKKIRWSNVGSQYDWDNRQYPMLLTPVPELITNLASFAQDIMKEEIPDIYSYTPESVIINYYDKKNYMGGHLDDGENDQKSPIFSFCFGLSCVFLMGDRTRDFSPLPLLLEAGDMFVMSGYSRNCYHGVPRVIEGSFDSTKFDQYIQKKYPNLADDIEKNSNLKTFDNNEFHVINYFKENRLNLNFRQVNIDQKPNNLKNEQKQ